MTTKYKWDHNKHSVYALHYHLIICVKYRRYAFTNNDIINTLKERVLKVSEDNNILVTNQEVDKDHIHIIFKSKPQSDLIRYINSLKGATSRYLRNKYPELKKILWGNSFWSNSYCLISTGQVTLDQLKKYVENQGKNENL